MTTVNCTFKEFNTSAAKFMEIMGNKKHTQEQVSGAHKALGLKYLGMKCTQDELEKAAVTYDIVTQGAIARGWTLEK